MDSIFVGLVAYGISAGIFLPWPSFAISIVIGISATMLWGFAYSSLNISENLNWQQY